MSYLLPKNIVREVRCVIFAKADAVGYMHKTKRENGAFMDSLVKEQDVGGVLSQYLAKEKIRTYIKDGVLRVYTKLKRECALPVDLDNLLPIIYKHYSRKASKLEDHKDIILLKLDNNDLVLAAYGTLLKWETALRKALEFISKSPGLPPEKQRIHILLVVAVLNCATTESDRIHLITALKFVGVELHFME